MATQKKDPTFEELLRQLEEKVGRLEQGGLSLDDSLATYEEAVALAQRCQQMLDSAELRITRIRETFRGYDAAPASEEDEAEVEA